MFPMPGIFNQQGPTAEVPIPNYFWPMQEGTGTTTTDTIVSSVATLSSAVWNVGGGRASSNCVDFASGQWVYIADPFYYDPITICAWVYPTTTGTQKSFIVKRNDTTGTNVSTSGELEMGMLTTNKLYFWAWGPNGSPQIININGATALPANAWSHVAASSGGDSQTCYVYLNGVIDGSVTQSAYAINNGVAAFQFGGRSSNIDSRYFAGRMQEVRVYNYRLSEAEMGAVAAAATP